ncbi:hypothetical protein [Pedobacter endophyticus]|uniref:Uncharacterized protein n=1 Tax=Pedobacter endophyticus TaxID=2789740 RepID=A0A7U3SPU5_9SPHI|nr:hypothetical protein [Pedobacter endophyticus]QPH38888.1 hypothetical protein IZT61_17750 [Pedobacter endophyticus]
MSILQVPFITFYSATVATISLILAGTLAILKFKEYWRDNRGIATNSAWTGDINGTDYIYLTNLSSIPILINHWELEWHETRFLIGKTISPIHLHSDEDLHLTLEPRKRKSLPFEEQYRFNWPPKNKPKAKLYIRLFMTGRKKNLVLKVA